MIMRGALGSYGLGVTEELKLDRPFNNDDEWTEPSSTSCSWPGGKLNETDRSRAEERPVDNAGAETEEIAAAEAVNPVGEATKRDVGELVEKMEMGVPGMLMEMLGERAQDPKAIGSKFDDDEDIDEVVTAADLRAELMAHIRGSRHPSNE